MSDAEAPEAKKSGAVDGKSDKSETSDKSDASDPSDPSDPSDKSPQKKPAGEKAAAGEKPSGGEAAKTEGAKEEGAKDAAGEKGAKDAAGKDEKAADKSGQAAASKQKSINVIYVADIDLMHYVFLRLRARPDEDTEINWRFENVTFLLNLVDVLASDERYIEIRKRKPRYSTLKKVEARTLEQRESEAKSRLQYQAEFDKAVKEAEDTSKKAVEDFQKIVERLEEETSRRRGGERRRVAGPVDSVGNEAAGRRAATGDQEGAPTTRFRR